MAKRSITSQKLTPPKAPSAAAKRVDEVNPATGAKQSGPNDTTTDDPGRPGVSDAAAKDSNPPGSKQTPDDPTGSGSHSASDPRHGGVDRPAASPSGADARIADAVDSIAKHRPTASVLDGPQQTDPTAEIDKARGASDASHARKQADADFRASARAGDGTTGIADQGSGAISDAPTGLGAHSAATVVHGADGIESAVTTDIANDPDFSNNPLVNTAKAINEVGTGRTIREIEQIFNEGGGGGPAAAAPAAGADGPVMTTVPGGFKFVHPNGDTTVLNRDGTVVNKTATSTTIARPDGSKTTQTDNEDGSRTFTETPPTEADPVDAGIPDESQSGAAFRHVSQGLKDRTAPRGGGGDGHTDPVDDGGIGSAAAGAGHIVDPKNSLLGGDTRGDVVRSGGTGGNGLPNFNGDAGAIDNREADVIGGGLEDDPLAGLDGPAAAFPSNGRTIEPDDPETELADGGDLGDNSVDDDFHLVTPSVLDRAVLDLRPERAAFDLGIDDGTDDPQDETIDDDDGEAAAESEPGSAD
jgi:hypothetical protein